MFSFLFTQCCLLYCTKHFIHLVGCFPSLQRSHKFRRFSSHLQTSSRTKKKEKCSYIQTEAILDITSLATASFVVDVNRSLDSATDLLPRIHIPILEIVEIREKDIFLRIHDAITEYD